MMYDIRKLCAPPHNLERIYLETNKHNGSAMLIQSILFTLRFWIVVDLLLFAELNMVLLANLF